MSSYALVLTDAELARYRVMAAHARVDEAAAWARAGIVPGARVADIGCGPGAALLAMAEVVGEDGSVVGVDADAAAVATAQELIGRSGLRNATARVGQATATGLEPAGFDVVVMRHVLAHNGGREAEIVQELATLVRPGGCVYLVDVEMTAARIVGVDADILDLSDRYVAFHRARGNDLQVGLRLGLLLRDAGLEVLDHSGKYTIMSPPSGIRPPAWVARDAMVAEGVATPEDVQRWEAALVRAEAAAERPTMFMPLFSATGRRPDDAIAEA